MDGWIDRLTEKENFTDPFGVSVYSGYWLQYCNQVGRNMLFYKISTIDRK